MLRRLQISTPVYSSASSAVSKRQEQFRAHLDARGIAYTVQPEMVRGLDYYTRTAFEIVGNTGLGAQNTIVGGGRYDGLAETLGGPPTKGFGFAFGLDRMVMALPESVAKELRVAGAPEIFIVSLGETARQHGYHVARQLRAAGLSVLIDFADRKMKKAMALADKSRARHALIIGENEVNERRYALKNLTSGEQESLTVADIIAKLNRN